MKSSKPEELNPDFNLKPNVRYIDLPKRFIAGEIVLSDKKDVCAPGIKVYLSNGAKMIETQTDSFGDFEFDGLMPAGHTQYASTMRDTRQLKNP